MKRGYNELVGIQVAFSKVMARYRMTHFYQWKGNCKPKGHGVMRGFDMVRVETVEMITENLRNAYSPLIVAVWRLDTPACSSELLQFEVGATPEELTLAGDWYIWVPE
ncbi:unnamed protein product [marine sediment metagenome]|uniref:Uncharacterized protein n=1 Tax=marine sediment metagenome TaxID=412755 RepID=X1SAC7_9ZZZZ